jgi:DNA-binding NarL/FixJ family response regulator
MSIRILLADDHQIIREGLRMLLEKQGDMEVVAEAEEGRTAVRLAREVNPDVIILDIAMPDLNGIEAARQILTECPTAKVLALSMHSDRRFVSEMLKAGAKGYLLKDCASEELARAVHSVMGGETYLSPAVAGEVVQDYVHRLKRPAEATAVALSAREREVLQLLAEGRNTKKIALQLNISVKTVETHRQHIMGKLHLHSVAELTKYAVREGLTTLEV